jgi:hypothetical protein
MKQNKVYIIVLILLCAFVLSFFFFGCQKANEKIETVKTWVYFEGVVSQVTEDGNSSYAWVQKGNDTYHLYKMFFSSEKNKLKEGMRVFVKADTANKKPRYTMTLAWVK